MEIGPGQRNESVLSVFFTVQIISPQIDRKYCQLVTVSIFFNTRNNIIRYRSKPNHRK